ncbi:hypothetical protein J3A83DRAFT_4086291, partial [Scleroderma citrinum]
GTDGKYCFQAGSVCIAEGLSARETRLGNRLDDIHLSGNVPQCEWHRKNMDRFFKRMTVGKPVI